MSGRLIIPPGLEAGDVLLRDDDGTLYEPGPVLLEAIRATREGRPVPGEEELSDDDVKVLNALLRLAVVAPGNRANRLARRSRRRGRR